MVIGVAIYTIFRCNMVHDGKYFSCFTRFPECKDKKTNGHVPFVCEKYFFNVLSVSVF